MSILRLSQEDPFIKASVICTDSHICQWAVCNDLFLIFFSGASAGIIDIGATWMSDLKEGVCAQAFWFNREQCCWMDNNTFPDEDDIKGCDRVSPIGLC